jgi:hypothetical protein
MWRDPEVLQVCFWRLVHLQIIPDQKSKVMVIMKKNGTVNRAILQTD